MMNGIIFFMAFINMCGADIAQIGDDYQVGVRQVHTTSLMICFVFLSLGLGSFLKQIANKTKIPYTPMLFLIGIAWGYYYKNLGVVGISCLQISQIDPNGVLIIFLPVLVYESGFNFDWHIFKRLFFQIVILAFPCVLILSFIIQFSLKLVLGYGDDYYTWESAFMFGSILSSTDTVAVLALLKGCGAGKRFTSLIEGESLLNDGASMVLFYISYGIVKGTSSTNIYQIASIFTQLTLGGSVLGIIFGLISVYWIKRIFNDEILVLNITIISCYLVFFVAEYVEPFGIKMSGILALVSLSLFMSAFGRTRISRQADKAIHEFWEYVVFACETVIFLMAGIIVAIRVLINDSEIQTSDVWKIFGLWGCVMVGRFLAIAVFMPWLQRIGYGLLWREIIVLTYGGIRGAVGITFALIVTKDDSLPEKLKDIIIFQMSGVAILTLAINGTTISFIVRALGLSTQSIIREKILADFLQKLDEEIEDECNRNMADKYLQQAQWDEVKRLCGQQQHRLKQQSIRQKIAQRENIVKEIAMKTLKKTQKNLKSNNEVDDIQQELIIDESEADNEINMDLLVEVRRIFLMSLKGIYWKLFEQNQCSPDSLILLTQSANLDLDNDKDHMNSWDFLGGQFSEQYINTLFYMKDWWLIGKISRTFLFTYIFYIYDVVSSYIEALDILKDHCKTFNFPEQLIQEMIGEVEDNRKSAVQYIEDYLEVSFPEISRELHTKKAAFQVLEYEKSIIKNNLMSGQLEDKEYKQLKFSIDRRVSILNNMNPTWELPDLHEILSKHGLFRHINDSALRKLISECREESFGRDQIIYKEGDRVNEALIIMRGGGSEYSDRSKLREKRMLGDVAPVYMLVAPSIRYQTSFIADCVINATFFKVSTLQQLMRQIPQFEEEIWRYSLAALSKIYQEQLKPLCFFTKQQIHQVLNNSAFVKLKKNQIINIDQGAILLKGSLVEAKSNQLVDVPEEQESRSMEDENQNQNQISMDKKQIVQAVNLNEWKRDAIVLIAPVQFQLKAYQSSFLLVFKHWSQLQVINQIESQGTPRRSRIQSKKQI